MPTPRVQKHSRASLDIAFLSESENEGPATCKGTSEDTMPTTVASAKDVDDFPQVQVRSGVASA